MADDGFGAGESEIGFEDTTLLRGVQLEKVMGARAGFEGERVLAGEGKRTSGGEGEKALGFGAVEDGGEGSGGSVVRHGGGGAVSVDDGMGFGPVELSVEGSGGEADRIG